MNGRFSFPGKLYKWPFLYGSALTPFGFKIKRNSPNSILNCRGFTYMGTLVLLIISGIALTEASKYWQTIAKREREMVLLFRGDQIRRAIQSYYKKSPSGRTPSYPQKLKDLLRDPRMPGVTRHLRKLYKDPMTDDGQWRLILDTAGRVKGVFSKSSEVPLKTGNFSLEYNEFEKATKYSDWKFVCLPDLAVKEKL